MNVRGNETVVIKEEGAEIAANEQPSRKRRRKTFGMVTDANLIKVRGSMIIFP